MHQARVLGPSGQVSTLPRARHQTSTEAHHPQQTVTTSTQQAVAPQPPTSETLASQDAETSDSEPSEGRSLRKRRKISGYTRTPLTPPPEHSSEVSEFLEFENLRMNLAAPPTPPAGEPASAVMKKKPGRPRMIDTLPVDEDGNPDVYEKYFRTLERGGRLDCPIEEMGNMDWRAEKEMMQKMRSEIVKQQSFIPRVGEVVLVCFTLGEGDEIAYNPEVGTYQLRSHEKGFIGNPSWRAGVVTQVPEERVVVKDLLVQTQKENEVNYSGFRVETLPDPTGKSKAYSKHYKYVSLHQMRPYSSRNIFLKRLGKEQLHPSVDFALKIVPTFNVTDKSHVTGKKDKAVVLCNGVYIGPELILVGDAIRIIQVYSPDADVDVLIVESIRFKITGLGSAEEEWRLVLRGKAYTNDQQTAEETGDQRIAIEQSLVESHRKNPKEAETAIANIKKWAGRAVPLKTVYKDFPTGMQGYKAWYYLHNPENLFEIDHEMVLGRLLSSTAQWVLYQDLDISRDVADILQLREEGRDADFERIGSRGKEWFWGESRIECLGLDSFNGIEVGMNDPVHTPDERKMHRAILKVIDGTATAADLKAAHIPRAQGRPRLAASSMVAMAVEEGVAGGEWSAGEIESGVEGMGLGGFDGEDEDDEEDEEDEEGEESDEDRMSKRSRL